jgi:hypothetical protein
MEHQHRSESVTRCGSSTTKGTECIFCAAHGDRCTADGEHSLLPVDSASQGAKQAAHTILAQIQL